MGWTINWDAWEAVGTLLTGVSAAIALVIFNHRQMKLAERQYEAQWDEKLGTAYRAFWSDPDLDEVRYWIVSDQGYRSIRPILMQRLTSERNRLGSEKNIVLDKIDRFFAIMVSLEAGEGAKLTDRHKRKIAMIYGYYKDLCVEIRPELTEYARHHWVGLFQEIEDGADHRKRKVWQRIAKGLSSLSR